MLTPAQAGKPGGFAATISPRSFTTYFGCFPRGCTAYAQFTISASGGLAPYTYYWNWGNNAGGSATGQTGPLVISNTYISLVAKYTVTFTAIDSAGRSDTATATVSVKVAR